MTYLTNQEDATVLQDKKDRGRRLKTLRTMVGLNQVEFAKVCGVSGITITLWESGQTKALSQKGAQKVIEALKKLHIQCSVSWLWLGIGSSPNFIQSTQVNPNPNHLSLTKLYSQIEIIKKEMDLFLKLMPNSTTLEVEDDAMLNYQIGDFVGAVWLEMAPQEILDEDVVVELPDCKKLIRRIGYDENKKEFLLYPSNMKSTTPDLFIANAPIQRIAKITRIWRMI